MGAVHTICQDGWCADEMRSSSNLQDRKWCKLCHLADSEQGHETSSVAALEMEYEAPQDGYGVGSGPEGTYVGQWSQGLKHGDGHQQWSNGREYQGQFRQGMVDGHGFMTWERSNGCQTYEGQYVKNLRHGQGKLIFADGRSYDGNWDRGKKHGHGTFVDASGEVRTGFWQQDYVQDWDDEVACSNDSGMTYSPGRSGGA